MLSPIATFKIYFSNISSPLLIFKDHLLHLEDLSNITSSGLDRIRVSSPKMTPKNYSNFQCEKVVVPHWQVFFPSLTDHQVEIRNHL